MSERSGQIVALTGAAGGMGRVIAMALLESGRRLVLVALDQPAHVQIAEMMILPVNRY